MNGNQWCDNPKPVEPLDLPPLAEAIFRALSRETWASCIILGGGVALKHYDDFRETRDIDAWWDTLPDSEVRDLLGQTLRDVATSHGYHLDRRQFGVTESFDFVNGETGAKDFSFQIATRDVAIDEPVPSPWPPLLMETLRDNIGSKMNALVMRGAPRDFVDIFRVVHDGLIQPQACWELWQMKNPQSSMQNAKAQALTHLSRIESRRPLEGIGDCAERDAASRLRHWFRLRFLGNLDTGAD